MKIRNENELLEKEEKRFVTKVLPLLKSSKIRWKKRKISRKVPYFNLYFSNVTSGEVIHHVIEGYLDFPKGTFLVRFRMVALKSHPADTIPDPFNRRNCIIVEIIDRDNQTGRNQVCELYFSLTKPKKTIYNKIAKQFKYLWETALFNAPCPGIRSSRALSIFNALVENNK